MWGTSFLRFNLLDIAFFSFVRVSVFVSDRSFGYSFGQIVKLYVHLWLVAWHLVFSFCHVNPLIFLARSIFSLPTSAVQYSLVDVCLRATKGRAERVAQLTGLLVCLSLSLINCVVVSSVCSWVSDQEPTRRFFVSGSSGKIPCSLVSVRIAPNEDY